MNRPQLPAPKCHVRSVLSKCITGGSLALIAVLAIPAAVLFGLIYLVWTAHGIGSLDPILFFLLQRKTFLRPHFPFSFRKGNGVEKSGAVGRPARWNKKPPCTDVVQGGFDFIFRVWNFPD